MREGEASGTAQRVAAYRLGFERLPAPFGDPGADERLARDVAGSVERQPNERMATYLQARTSFFDRVVVNALERGTTQFAVIGAGYDGRALRYAKRDVRWFELDHPDTQRDKRRRLDRLAIPTPGITFVAADLVKDEAAAALLAAGFEPDAPSVLLCEGVAVYLEPAVLARLLEQLRSLATPGTRFAMTAGVPGTDPARRAQFAARVAELGEPVALAGADVPSLLTAARWRTVELPERARRVGMLLAAPVWEPGRPPTASRVGKYMERTFHRGGADRLVEHLTATYGVQVTRTRRLDVGVLRVDRADGPAWVARVFPAARPIEVARADARVLRHLADAGYPAERPAVAEPVSGHDGQAVLVTEFVDGKAPRPTQVALRRLGESLGRLHTLPDAPARPGGAWHHLAFEGGPDAEIAALRELFEARVHVTDEQRELLAARRERLAGLDDLRDLPTAFSHADFVAANAVVPSGGDPVIIDWAGAGVAPRLWSLGFLLWSAGQAGPRHVDAVVQGYRRHVRLDPAELDRLESAVVARPLVFDTWAYVTGRRRLTDAVAGQPGMNAKARDIADRARAAFRRAD